MVGAARNDDDEDLDEDYSPGAGTDFADTDLDAVINDVSGNPCSSSLPHHMLHTIVHLLRLRRPIIASQFPSWHIADLRSRVQSWGIDTLMHGTLIFITA